MMQRLLPKVATPTYSSMSNLNTTKLVELHPKIFQHHHNRNLVMFEVTVHGVVNPIPLWVMSL
jgi:hypothetical protein